MDRTVRTDATFKTADTGAVDFKLEVVVIPVSDVDRAKKFYGDLGWRLDADFAAGSNFRVVQFTPPGSPCSIHFGKGVTASAPGSAKGIYLVVSDIVAARAELMNHGAEVSEIAHRTAPGTANLKGPDPERHSYASMATFNDPDGNIWILQEINQRLPGRVQGNTTFGSSNDLAGALRRAATAHGKHEERIGQRDEDWPDWYADYIVKEQAGEPLPL